MVTIIQSPNEFKFGLFQADIIKIFLAGGISNCPNWQEDICNRLLHDRRLEYNNVVVFNPRCKEKPEEEPQVKWEYEKLGKSNIIAFWFSYGSMNPITLFEYGSHLKSGKKLIVGCHPDYERRNNVIIQTKLAKSKIEVQNNLDDFYDKIIESIENFSILYNILKLF